MTAAWTGGGMENGVPNHSPMLHMLCGKIAAGKSTLSARLGSVPTTIVVVQDHWMANLWPDEIRSVADYGRMVARLRAAMGPHVVELLRSGLSVVLDWPANTVASRRWMRGIFEAAGAAHAFGPLPDGFPGHTLPVTFSFDPRTAP